MLEALRVMVDEQGKSFGEAVKTCKEVFTVAEADSLIVSDRVLKKVMPRHFSLMQMLHKDIL